ncbi:MAG: nicotinate-nucleotide adenylyltransferase [Lewinellaceae bacterium]|nr:nicotinate-nucleotide adenylyltransferase [Saprospiraceae bacterium]MCB9312879.1 nicotinate-nucleotide adenylyltransferase [Lewinellaceae bacterium]
MTAKATRIGLFFGSFNPIHIGHLIIAQHMLEHADLDKVWFVVSPHNPHKPRKTLARDADRLHMVRLAIDDNPGFHASNIEFSLPKPSYTVDTLAYLRDQYPEHAFSLIMGGDNLASLAKWKNYEILLRDYTLLVYRRPGHEGTDFDDHPSVRFFDAPQLNISATFIREQIREGKSIRYLVPDPVFEFLDGGRLYRDLP